MLKGTLTPHGITRRIAKEGSIHEKQTRNGMACGYHRFIYDSGKHKFGLCKDDEQVGTWIWYNPDNTEESREDYGDL